MPTFPTFGCGVLHRDGPPPDLPGDRACQARLDLAAASALGFKARLQALPVAAPAALVASRHGKRRHRARGHRDLRRTIEDDVHFLLPGGALRSIAVAGTSSSRTSARTWSATLVSMLRADGAPDV